MPNTNVFRGSDASLVLAVDDNSTVEGGLADTLISQYDFSNVVGRLQQVEVQVKSDLRPYHEIGKRFASEIRPGNININGTIKRAHINGALVKLLLGGGATSPPQEAAQPKFNIVINLQNPALPDNSSKIILFGVKFDSWNLNVPEDNFIMEEVSFMAERISGEETPIAN